MPSAAGTSRVGGGEVSIIHGGTTGAAGDCSQGQVCHWGRRQHQPPAPSRPLDFTTCTRQGSTRVMTCCQPCPEVCAHAWPCSRSHYPHTCALLHPRHCFSLSLAWAAAGGIQASLCPALRGFFVILGPNSRGSRMRGTCNGCLRYSGSGLLGPESLGFAVPMRSVLKSTSKHGFTGSPEAALTPSCATLRPGLASRRLPATEMRRGHQRCPFLGASASPGEASPRPVPAQTRLCS